MPIKLNGATSGSLTIDVPAVVGGDLTMTLQAGAWTAYTPTIGGTGWSLGNGTINGAYCQIGKVVAFRVAMTMGTTTVFGSGGLQISYPITAVNSGAHTFAGNFLDDSANQAYVLSIRQLSTTNMVVGAIVSAAGQTNGVSTNTPVALASGDIVRFSGVYEAA